MTTLLLEIGIPLCPRRVSAAEDAQWWSESLFMDIRRLTYALRCYGTASSLHWEETWHDETLCCLVEAERSMDEVERLILRMESER